MANWPSPIESSWTAADGLSQREEPHSAIGDHVSHFSEAPNHDPWIGARVLMLGRRHHELGRPPNCDRSCPRPASLARSTACARSATCSLAKMFETWLRTV